MTSSVSNNGHTFPQMILGKVKRKIKKISVVIVHYQRHFTNQINYDSKSLSQEWQDLLHSANDSQPAKTICKTFLTQVKLST